MRFRHATPNASVVPQDSADSSVPENVKAIPSTYEYYASSDGKVFKKKGKVLSELKLYHHKKHGYLTATVTDLKGNRKTRGVHQLVAAAFLGPCKIGNVVDHIDRNKKNNDISNLRYISKKDNRLNSSTVNVTERNFKVIRRMFRQGFTFKEIADKNEVAESTAKRMCGPVTFMGKKYKNLL